MEKKKWIFTSIFIITLILIDVISKVFLKDSYAIAANTIGLKGIINQGVVFGTFQGNNIAFIIISIVIIAAVLYFYKKEPKLHFGLNLILAGAIANLIDRFVYGGVVDFIYLRGFSTFNFADVFIVLGVIICLYTLIWRKHRQKAF